MKNKSIILGALVAIALTSVSCRTSEVRTQTKTKFTTETPIVLEPKFVDYEVDLKNKVQGMAEGKVKPHLTADMYAEKAGIQAAQNSNADFIYEPNISVEIRGKRIKATVTGYPAKYTSFRKVDIKDSLEVAFYEKQQGVRTKAVDIKKKRKRFLGIF